MALTALIELIPAERAVLCEGNQRDTSLLATA